MSAGILTGRDNNAQGAPYASVSYGPLLFALPIPDTQNANTPDPAATWNYALNVQTPDVIVERRPMPTRWNWPLASPLTLRVNASAIDWNPTPEAPRLPAGPAAKRKPTRNISLIPYGCAKFRISMFPVCQPE